MTLCDGENIHLDCIHFNTDSSKFEVDELSFEKRVYEKYQQQFFYNNNSLLKELSKHIKVDNINIISEIEIKDKLDGDNTKDRCELKENATIVLESLDASEKIFLENIILKKCKMSALKSETREKLEVIIAYPPYHNALKQLLLYEADSIESIIKNLIKHKGDKTLSNFNKKYKYAREIWLNKRFLKTGRVEIAESYYVLDYLYKLNNNNKLKKTKIDSKIVKTIKDNLNSNYGCYCIRFSDLQIWNLINKHFIVIPTKNNGYRLEKLRVNL